MHILPFPSFTTFEIFPLFIHGPVFSGAFVVIYRPGSQAIKMDFINEFADVLEHCSRYSKCYIVGDVNIHLDDPNDAHAAAFFSELENFDLRDHVRQPTHERGHQMDVFISRADDSVTSIKVDPPSLISDHSLVVAPFDDVTTPNKTPDRKRVQRRLWKQFDIERFTEDLQQSELILDPPEDVTELFDCYIETLLRLLNIHAPEATVTLYAKPTAPWFDTECHLAKVETRRLEKKYRMKKDSDSEWKWREQFKLQRNLFQAKFQAHWTEAIESCSGDMKSIADHSVDGFAAFFADKVAKIRSSTVGSPPPDITHRSVPEPLIAFDPVTVEEVILRLKRHLQSIAVLIQLLHGWSRKSMLSLRRLLHACAMLPSHNAHYRSARRERSRVQFSRNRHWILSITTHIDRSRTSASCRKWLSELSIVGSLPTVIITI